MWHKVTAVVYRRFNKHWKSKKNSWNANPPNSAKWWNLDIKTSSPDTLSLRVQMPECVSYSRRWICLGNKYFLTSTSTRTNTWHASTSTSTSTRQLYLSADQVPVPVPSTTRLQNRTPSRPRIWWEDCFGEKSSECDVDMCSGETLALDKPGWRRL